MEITKIGNFIIAEGGIDNDEDGIQAMMSFIKETLILIGKPEPQNVIRKIAESYWQKRKAELKKPGISNKIQKLFKAKNKRDVERVAKSIRITGSEFSALIFNAKDQGFIYTRYFKEFLPKDINPDDLPPIIHRKGMKQIETVGRTTLSPSQLERVITQRKNIHAHLFEKQAQWHCFYFTFNDVQGSHGSMGSHIHYISSLWRLDLKKIWSEFEKKDHPWQGVHIPYDHEG